MRAKTDECGVEMVLRSLSTFGSVEIKTDGEPSFVEIARRVQARRDRDNDSGTDECWRTPRDWSGGTCDWNSAGAVASVSPGCARSFESENHSRYTVVSMDVAAFCLDGGALSSPIKERNRLRMREQEVVGMNQRWYHLEKWSWQKLQTLTRAGKLDSAWVTEVWVGRVDRSNEHLLLATKGCIRSRVVRRTPDGNQASYHAEVQGLPWDTLKGSAEMSRNATVRPGEPPRPSRGRPRKDGSPAQARTTTTTGRQEATHDDPMPGSSEDHRRQPTTEEDVVDQSIVMDSARVSDEGTDQGVLRMDQEEGISAEEQARRRLRSKQPARRPLTDDETFSKRLKREATIAAIKQEILKTVAERGPIWNMHTNFTQASEH